MRIRPRRLFAELVADSGFSAVAAMISFFLLRYLHGEWQPGWAVGCGVLAGVVVRRAVEPTYRSFPGFLRRPLSLAIVTVGAILVVWATLAAPGYGGLLYAFSRVREASTLLVVAVSLGLGSAGVIYSHSRLQSEVKQRERFEEDLRLARGIQESLLSDEFPRIPWVDTWAFNVPSRDVGGDYYEVFGVDSGDLEFAIGDVSGKGVPAALLMSTLQSTFLGASSSDRDLARVCARVNRFLVERTSPERYASFFVGRLTEDAHLAYVNAGHNPPRLLRDGELHRLMSGGMPLGLFAEAGYELQKTRLISGDLVLCYTDGVTEAMSPEEEEFGEQRLAEVAIRQRGRSAEEVVGAIQTAVEAHTRGAPQHDDLTLLALCYR
jgi:sigma-B regulation protein RsbU (phosphoserine phosphatase)